MENDDLITFQEYLYKDLENLIVSWQCAPSEHKSLARYGNLYSVWILPDGRQAAYSNSFMTRMTIYPKNHFST